MVASAGPSAATIPGVMFAPREFDTTGRADPRAAQRSFVVVVFPFVALTRATSRSAVRVRSSFGSTASAARPPMTLPDPK